MKKSVLDDEEKAILESYESGEWVSVKDTKKPVPTMPIRAICGDGGIRTRVQNIAQ
jgi:hypothetical protein